MKHCPSCQTPVARDQPVCVECGLPDPAPSPFLPALLRLVWGLLAIGGILALEALRRDRAREPVASLNQ